MEMHLPQKIKSTIKYSFQSGFFFESSHGFCVNKWENIFNEFAEWKAIILTA